jgi:hypothetical protein
MEAFRRCKNVAVKIFEIECIFGLDWTVDVICPWILDTIDLETSLGVAKRHRLEASVTSVRCSPRMQHLSGPEATPSTKTICPPKRLVLLDGKFRRKFGGWQHIKNPWR